MYKHMRKYFVLGPLCCSLLGGALLLSETAAHAEPEHDSALIWVAEKSDNNGRFGRDYDNGRHRGDDFKNRDDKRGYNKEKRNNRDGRKHEDRYDRRDRAHRRDRDDDGDRRYHRNNRNDRDHRGDRDDWNERDHRDRRDRYHNNRGDSKFGLESERRGFDIDRRNLF